MKQASHSKARFNLIVTLWGLLFTKCFLLEFWVRHYAVPINSLIYVWTLSTLMAAVATVVYSNLHKQTRAELMQSPGFLLSVTTITVTALFAIGSLVSPVEQSGYVLAAAALLIAIFHGWRLFCQPRPTQAWIAPCWLVVASAIAYSGSPVGFLLFAFGIFCLWVIPGIARFFALRQQAAEPPA